MTVNIPWPLAEKDLQDYERDGVVCLRNVLDPSWIEALRVGMEDVIHNPGPQAAVDESKGGRFLQDTFMWTRSEVFWRLQSESPVPSITAQLMRSKNSYLMADVMFTKEPNTPNPTPWHQDQGYGWYDGHQVCSVWIPLDSVTLESGGLEYVRGSHLKGEWYAPINFASGITPDTPFKRMPDIEANRDSYDLIHFDTEPGDIIFHHLLTLHGAPGNMKSDRRRRALAFRYAGDDATYAIRSVGPKPIWDPGLQHGDRFGCELFPRVWPRDGEIPRFWERPRKQADSLQP